MKTVVLRTDERTKSNSFSDAICLVSSNETDKTDNCPVTINYVNKYVIVL
jgi:hypothetical protein